RHTLTVQAWLSSRSPQAVTYESRGIKASSTGFKIPLLNLALGCSFPAGVSEAAIDEEIEALKSLFASRNVPWYWWMNSSPSPANIRELLHKHGIEFDDEDPPLPAMAAPIGEISNLPTYPGHIQVWQAQSLTDLKSASLIRRIAFKFPAGEALTYFEDMAADWLNNPDVKLFLAGDSASEPVSIGAIIQAAGIPGVYVMATLPDQHRKGYGKAILTRLMNEAAKEGHSILALTASQAGFGLYSQFGFEHIFGFDFYIPAE
ncbi:MAG: GNAT family N-acetyltransferase, partial [Anaerolineales bacterium]|nr:GNAT family N-acetyltransferase [Anaerolineales bacterium]